MKKAFALVLAVAMIASMAVASFAVVKLDPDNNTDGVDKDSPISSTVAVFDGDLEEFVPAGDTVAFGETVYLLLLDNATGAAVNDADAVKGLKVDAKWTKNGDYVKDVEIVKKDGIYVIAIDTTGSSTGTVTVLGEIALKGTTYWTANDKNEKAKVDEEVEIQIDLKYDGGTAADEIDLVDGEKRVYNFEDVNFDETTIEYGELTAEVSTKGMKKVLLSWNDDEVEEIYDAYIDADLVFINCTGAFRRTAEVTIDATDYPYLYEVVDGELVAVDAEYDEWTEEFTFKTRTLGNYVLSDTELEVAEEVVATNPSTGAAA